MMNKSVIKLFFLVTILSFISQYSLASINLGSNNQEILNKEKEKKGNGYFVSKNGNDENPGTREFPFKTLEKAASMVRAGDTCFIYGGVYREILKVKYSGNQGNPIVFKAVSGENVSISAMDEMNNPTESDGVFTYNVGFNFTTENFVLCDGEPLTLARWPNKTNTKLLDPEAATIVNKGSSPTGIVNLNFPSNFTTENLEGATVWANAESKWSCWTSNVVGFDSISKKILLKGFGDSWWVNERHNPARAHKHYGEGIFYVAGAEVLLDAPGEWFFQKDEQQLKLNLPKGKDASTSVISVNKRKWTIDFRNRSFIEVVGIDVVGAPITFQNATNCTVKNGVIKHFYYSFGNNSPMGITKSSGILLSGEKNSIESAEIYGSAGAGILVTGTNNKVVNCDIHDVNFLGSHAGAPISLKGKGHLISHNSIHETGRVCISMGGGGHTIQYNHIYNPGRNSEDLGVLKCGGTDADNIHIHHNKIHNDNGKFIGIYFDNYSNNIIAHHNIIDGMKDGIRSNRPGHYHIIYNNNVTPDINNKYGPWNGPLDQFGTVIVNNKSQLPLMAKPEVIQQNNVLFNSVDDLIEKGNTHVFLKDFPQYIGALDTKETSFIAGHNFKNPPKLEAEIQLPFIRNHVKNGSFDYARTYEKTYVVSKNKLEHWETENKKNVSVEHFPGFNFPTNPEDRLSIHGFGLILKGMDDATVIQKMNSLKPNRKYSFGAYVKVIDTAIVQIQIKQKGKVIAQVSSNDIEYSKNSNWKFIKLDFELGSKFKNIELHITKLGAGKASVDNVGIIPIPEISLKE